ncbi:hypothetical protein JCM8097_001295 [Rhodosporidiobolus ruineniae]
MSSLDSPSARTQLARQREEDEVIRRGYDAQDRRRGSRQARYSSLRLRLPSLSREDSPTPPLARQHSHQNPHITPTSTPQRPALSAFHHARQQQRLARQHRREEALSLLDSLTDGVLEALADELRGIALEEDRGKRSRREAAVLEAREETEQRATEAREGRRRASFPAYTAVNDGPLAGPSRPRHAHRPAHLHDHHQHHHSDPLASTSSSAAAPPPPPLSPPPPFPSDLFSPSAAASSTAPPPPYSLEDPLANSQGHLLRRRVYPAPLLLARSATSPDAASVNSEEQAERTARRDRARLERVARGI